MVYHQHHTAVFASVHTVAELRLRSPQTHQFQDRPVRLLQEGTKLLILFYFVVMLVNICLVNSSLLGDLQLYDEVPSIQYSIGSSPVGVQCMFDYFCPCLSVSRLCIHAFMQVIALCTTDNTQRL